MPPASPQEPITIDSLPTFERLWMPIWVFDSDRTRMVWANAAALELWDAADLDEFLERDFSDMSEATRTRLESLARQLAAGEQPVDQWTFYPRGKPVTVRVRRTGIRLGDGRLAMLHEANAIEQLTDPAALRGVEAVHHTNVMISLYGMDGRPIMRNPAAVRAYGEPVAGTVLCSLFGEPANAERLLATLRDGGAFSVEACMLTRAGPRWHGLDARAVTDPVSGAAAILVNEQAIDARREAEHRLAGERALLRTLIDSVPDLIFFKDADGTYLGCNRAFQTAVGRSEAEIAGRRDADLLPPDMAAMAAAEDRVVYETGEARTFDEAITLPDGRRLLLDTIKTPLRAPDGATVGLVGVARDVTERRRQAGALQEKEAALRAILDNFPFIVWLKDAQGRFLAVNAAFAESCGRGTPDQMVGLTDFDVWPEAVARRYAEDDRAVLNARTRKAVDEPIETGGAKRWVETFKTAVVGSGGALLGTAGFSRDITARVEATEALRRASADLVRSNAELEAFAYVVSHDLRQPLRSVASFLTLLERHLEGALDDDAREFLDFARSGAQRMDRLIVDLLEYSRIGRKVREMGPVPLGEALEEAMLDLEAAVAESGASVTAAQPLPVVHGDRAELVRLLQNLIGNALKYRTPDQTPEVRVCAAPDACGWRVSVADNGIGIPAEHRDRIFGIFQRLHGRDEYEGTGIGLAVCRKIAEHHGGRIWVDAGEGRGSVFHVTLPPAATPTPREV